MTTRGRGFVHPEGTVLEAAGGRYRVFLEEEGVVEASLRGRLKKERSPESRIVPGDRVALQRHDEGKAFTVEEVGPRRNVLIRAGPGGRRSKTVAANVDRALIVISVDAPPFRHETTDRFLALAGTCDIEATLVVNKTDLPPSEVAPAEIASLYESVGYRVLLTTVHTGEGIPEVERELREGVGILLGPSGVGKSTLLNALDPELQLRTAPVSRRGGRGRHTTVGARLLPLSGGGWVIDTPGFSDIGLWGAAPSELEAGFPELAARAPMCRFRECRHAHEPDCAVLAAVETGEIAETRYRSYRALLEEAETASSAHRG